MDSPFDFNAKLKEQRDLIASWYSNEENPILEGFTRDELKNWNETTAPDNSWMNYIREEHNGLVPYLPGLGLIEWYAYNTEASDEFITQIYNSTNNGSGLGHYLPSNTSSPWPQRAAGTDCIGFAQRSGGYGDHQWPLPDVKRAYPRTQSDSALSPQMYWDVYSYMIAGVSNTEVDDNDNFVEVGDLNRVRPGDILYYIWGS